jgi:hypothetical protein
VALVAVVGLGAVAVTPAHACGAARHVRALAHKHRASRPPLVIGDSTMIFAAPVLGGLGLEADARGCRQFGEGIRMLAVRRHTRTLPAVAVLALGANGPIGPGQIAATLRIMGSHRVLGLVTPRNSSANAVRMRRAARRHPSRVVLIDWVRFSASHGGWFAGDGLHVNGGGASAYARLIRRAVAPIAFPPVRALRLPRNARGAKGCGVVHRARHPMRVYVVRGSARVVCRRARALVRIASLRPVTGWHTYDWRRTHDGPWAWVYARRDGKAIVAAIAGREATRRAHMRAVSVRGARGPSFPCAARARLRLGLPWNRPRGPGSSFAAAWRSSSTGVASRTPSE